MHSISPSLWFDTQAEEAAEFYVSLFEDSKIAEISYYGDTAPMPAGTVLAVNFRLRGQDFIAFNGGPAFTFTEAVSFTVLCDSQEEVDHYWNALLDGGEESQCGWLKDKFGLSWQIVPTELNELIGHPDREKANRAMAAMLTMRKIDVNELRRAAEQT